MTWLLCILGLYTWRQLIAPILMAGWADTFRGVNCLYNMKHTLPALLSKCTTIKRFMVSMTHKKSMRIQYATWWEVLGCCVVICKPCWNATILPTRAASQKNTLIKKKSWTGRELGNFSWMVAAAKLFIKRESVPYLCFWLTFARYVLTGNKYLKPTAVGVLFSLPQTKVCTWKESKKIISNHCTETEACREKKMKEEPKFNQYEHQNFVSGVCLKSPLLPREHLGRNQMNPLLLRHFLQANMTEWITSFSSWKIQQFFWNYMPGKSKRWI